MVSELSVLILTYNEEIHIERCIKSLQGITNNIFVVDSYSTDETVNICENLGAKVYQRKWKNYAEQFQWGLDNCPINTEWIMRMDADEYIEPDLSFEIIDSMTNQSNNVSGMYIRRKQYFFGRWIKNGDRYPLNLLRIWRRGKGKIESRWMDEHIVLDEGDTIKLKGNIVDDNLNNTRWWTEKHNKYADREMIDILDQKYKLFNKDNALKNQNETSQAKLKRLIKEKVYNLIPVFVRPFLYFIYRYFFRLGFLDGIPGFAYHFFQGYWYRSLVDLRVYEAERKIEVASTNAERIEILERLTGLPLK